MLDEVDQLFRDLDSHLDVKRRVNALVKRLDFERVNDGDEYVSDFAPGWTLLIDDAKQRVRNQLLFTPCRVCNIAPLGRAHSEDTHLWWEQIESAHRLALDAMVPLLHCLVVRLNGNKDLARLVCRAHIWPTRYDERAWK